MIHQEFTWFLLNVHLSSSHSLVSQRQSEVLQLFNASHEPGYYGFWSALSLFHPKCGINNLIDLQLKA